MTTPSPQAVKKDFGFQQGRMTLPPAGVDCSTPSTNYIASSNTLPAFDSTVGKATGEQRETLHNISWKEKIRNVFRRRKKRGAFDTDPEVSNFPQPFSRATGAMVHSTPKIFDLSGRSTENLYAPPSSSEDEDELPSSVDDVVSNVKVGNKPKMDGANKLVDISLDGSRSPQSPSDVTTLSAGSSRRESSSQVYSSDANSSEDEQPVNRIKRKISSHSMGRDYQANGKNRLPRQLSAGNSDEDLYRSPHEKALSANKVDELISDEENKLLKRIKKPERIKGPHISRESLGRPSILAANDLQESSEQELTSSHHTDQDDSINFATLPEGGSRSLLGVHMGRDKCRVAKQIKRGRPSSKAPMLLSTNDAAKYNMHIVDLSSTISTKPADQLVKHLRKSHSSSTSASIVAKATEQKRHSSGSSPSDLLSESLEMTRSDSKKRFSASLLINKQILESPIKEPVIPAKTPLKMERNLFEQVKLKPVSNSPIKAEQKAVTAMSAAAVAPIKENVLPTKKKPTKLVSPTKELSKETFPSPIIERIEPQFNTATPTKENVLPTKKKPIKLMSPTKEPSKEMIPSVVKTVDTVTLPATSSSSEAYLLKPVSSSEKFSSLDRKSRRAKTVSQPVKAIGYMKEPPIASGASKPAWIEIAQNKTRRVSEALNSKDKLPQLKTSASATATIQEGIEEHTSTGTTNISSGLPSDGYVLSRLRTFSQNEESK